MREERAKYPAAGKAGRLAIERYLTATAGRRRLTASHVRVLLVVLARTALYSRVEETLRHKVISDETGLHPKTVSEALAALAEAGVIEYEPGLSSRKSVVRLPRATESHITPLSTESYTAPLADAEDPLSLPSTESYIAPPNGVTYHSHGYEKDLREGPTRSFGEESPETYVSYDSSPQTDRKPRSASDLETGNDEDLSTLGDLFLRVLSSTHGHPGIEEQDTHEEIRRISAMLDNLDIEDQDTAA